MNQHLTFISKYHCPSRAELMPRRPNNHTERPKRKEMIISSSHKLRQNTYRRSATKDVHVAQRRRPDDPVKTPWRHRLDRQKSGQKASWKTPDADAKDSYKKAENQKPPNPKPMNMDIKHMRWPVLSDRNDIYALMWGWDERDADADSDAERT